eukprot:999560-Pleurochrysis_carterae.AAC.1
MTQGSNTLQRSGSSALLLCCGVAGVVGNGASEHQVEASHSAVHSCAASMQICREHHTRQYSIVYGGTLICARLLAGWPSAATLMARTPLYESGVWHRGPPMGMVSIHWPNYSALASWLISTISQARCASGRGRVDPEHPPSVTSMRGTHHKAGLMPLLTSKPSP